MAASRPISAVIAPSRSVEWETGPNNAITIANCQWQFDPREERYFNTEYSKCPQLRIQTFRA